MIFNIKKYPDSLNIKIFGLKFKISDKTIKKIQDSTTSEESEKIFTNILKKGLNHYSHYVWLEYIIYLLNNFEFDRAKLEIFKYCNKYKNYKDIDRYLILANFADSVGISNERIKKASFLFKHFKENENKNILLNLLSNKSVAIVGNGPSEINKKLGSEIDKHDMVIRFNNYHINKISEDYGNKTDILVTINSPKIEINTHDKNLKAIIFSTNITYNYLLDGNLEFLYEISKKIPVSNLSDDLSDEIKKETNIKEPTSGFRTIIYILKNRKNYNIKKIDYYGFSFRQDQIDNTGTHYYEKNTIFDKQLRHSFIDEAQYMKEYLSKEFKDEDNDTRN